MPQCRTDPLLRGVFERISEVTGAHPRHFGSVQVVRYREGEYYATHHDQTHFVSPPLPEGARVLTLLMYLDDVEEGGETAFPDLGIEVAPKKGKAVLWPSVANENTSMTELFTFHQARPVVRGSKHVANVWIHQFDYFSPRVRRGCAMESFAEGSLDPRWEACQRLERRPEERCERA